jgi:uncharacterized protein
MRLDSEEFIEKNQTIKTAPGMISVLGAVVLDLALLLLFWFIAMMVITAAWMLTEFISNNGSLSDSAKPELTAQLIISLLGMYLAIAVLSFWRGRKLVFPAPDLAIKNPVLFALLTGAGLFFTTLILTNVLQWAGIGSKPGNQEILQNLSMQWPLLTIVFAVLLAPIFEELLFRKILFARLAQANHIVLAYFISGLLFALMHEPSPINGFADWLSKLLLYGGMGAAFAWVYRKTGKLWPAILAHAANNVLGMSALMLMA